MQYTKNDWRNRNKIKTPQGVQWLTIPVKQESLEQRIKDSKVFEPKWFTKHWKTISQNYGKAPHFKTYKDLFEELYLNIDTVYLSEINHRFIVAINQILGIKTKVSWSSDYSYGEGKTERLVRLVELTGGKEYISGPAAKGYLNENLFQEAGIKVSWIDYSNYPGYHQLFPPFEHGVSVLDLIFNEGEMAPKFMKSF
jgi:WbqC-like protein family